MEKKTQVTFATASKIEEILLDLDQLKGKINKNDKVEVPKRGSPSPVKVLKLAADVTAKVANPYAPKKEEVLEIALSLLSKTEATSVEDTEEESAPSAPTIASSSSNKSGTPVGTLEHSEISKKISADLGIPLETVEKITGAFVSQVSGSFVLGLVALANSLHFIASSHDKLPGHEARVKAIDDVRKQYVEAGTLTSRKSRS